MSLSSKSWGTVFLALALGVMLVEATPVLGEPLSEKDIQAIVKWAGCAEATVTIYPDGGVNGWFSVESFAEPMVSIALFGMAKLPPPAQVLILLHEVGHCHQWKNGTLNTLSAVDREWEADVFAAIKGCQLGLRPYWMAWLTAYVDQTEGYWGNGIHDTMLARTANALLHQGEDCRRLP